MEKYNQELLDVFYKDVQEIHEMKKSGGNTTEILKLMKKTGLFINEEITPTLTSEGKHNLNNLNGGLIFASDIGKMEIAITSLNGIKDFFSEYNPCLCDLKKDIIYPSIKNFELVSNSSGKKIKTKDMEDGYKVLVSHCDIRSNVFPNLFSNAVKYGKGDDIFLSFEGTQKSNGKERYIVGVTNETNRFFTFEEIEQMFNGERFEPDVAEGSGIGLRSVRETMEKYDGSICCIPFSTNESDYVKFKLGFIPANGSYPM
ncbi:MAG: sensor histidine kinase [Candidatus Aenigmarchaeota archaeon]|nr:sensor histidine kinase [Candidatus Aenigmarchaeota archaeon]